MEHLWQPAGVSKRQTDRSPFRRFRNLRCKRYPNNYFYDKIILRENTWPISLRLAISQLLPHGVGRVFERMISASSIERSFAKSVLLWYNNSGGRDCNLLIVTQDGRLLQRNNRYYEEETGFRNRL